MLLQQTTKYILKESAKVAQGKASAKSPLAFLTENIEVNYEPDSQNLYSLDDLDKIFKSEVKRLIQEYTVQIKELKKSGKS